MVSKTTPFQRQAATTLADRLAEPRRFIQVVAGPRQVGKTTMVQQVTDALTVPVRSASADEPTLKGTDWIAQQWDAARLSTNRTNGAVLVLDEIQKIPGWSDTVKRLWDEDTRAKRPLHVVLLGSAPLLIAQGLADSLAGRFETIPLAHWSFAEMHDAFGYSLDEYLFYGGYPGAAPLIGEPTRWARYVADSLIETSISRDVLLLTRVDKPALLRRLFELACRYSGQILSYTKMLGQLQDAGNTTTLAHYLDLLAGAGMVLGLPKYAGDVARSRGSSPKLQVLNTALMTVTSGLTLTEARADREFWGRLVESAVGAHLTNAAMRGECTVHYWRERNHEVDFIVQAGRTLTAIEVKSGRAPLAHAGTSSFAQAFQPTRILMVGGDGIALEEFLLKPVTHWIGALP
ncbi:ATP-binding protein [Gemmatimonas groenlandica]|uniref:ATP-binding protein n=1 Tax=Gemmatimonas groenlandica TaxID=2732249 RepID=A0A6M4IX64_9BACT|nr:ATP-binding protein [Gemmatimonas groenlandica]QJR36771.1 ATP-binding protein [Gemmatimonas groenlandica]